jgi:hypothetical protein
VAAKKDDNAGKALWPWGRVRSAAISDRLVGRQLS